MAKTGTSCSYTLFAKEALCPLRRTAMPMSTRETALSEASLGGEASCADLALGGAAFSALVAALGEHHLEGEGEGRQTRLQLHPLPRQQGGSRPVVVLVGEAHGAAGAEVGAEGKVLRHVGKDEGEEGVGHGFVLWAVTVPRLGQEGGKKEGERGVKQCRVCGAASHRVFPERVCITTFVASAFPSFSSRMSPRSTLARSSSSPDIVCRNLSSFITARSVMRRKVLRWCL